MFQICGITPLFSECNASYKGIAFDGCSYYLTVKDQEKIIKFDKSFQIMEAVPTRRSYTSICYDSGEKCFWAINGIFQGLFKLSRFLKETEQIPVESLCGGLSGVSYRCGDNSLLVATDERILHIDKCCADNIEEVGNCQDAVITGVASASPYYLYHFISDCNRLHVIAEDGSLLEEFQPPEGHQIQQVLYQGRQGGYDYFQMLTLKNGRQPHLLEAKMEKNVLEGICPCNGLCCEKLHGQDSCGWDECDSCGCNSRQTCSSPWPSCPTPCPPWPPCPPPCPPYPSDCNCGAVLESIALVEAAIAHILNAEGEKIQKALESDLCVSEILEVNREVNRTIIYATNLEHVLYAKLDALRECCKKTKGKCCEETIHECCHECCKEMMSNCGEGFSYMPPDESEE